ncbi:MAG: DUF5615 family PIN-like protein [Planctomycetes bacterium]|nr:DUF5615 family PIN-like protein [Planctomycetota bacterium]
MNFKLDEHLPAEIAGDLRSVGHDAATVQQLGLAGSSDSVLLARARDEGRILLTMDKGIGNIRAYPPGSHPGIVLFRPHAIGRRATLAFVRRHLDRPLQMTLGGHLVVVSDTGIRVR